MSSYSWDEGVGAICKNLGLPVGEFSNYMREDTIGGYPDRWPVGSVWEVEGKILYAIVRYLRPPLMVEIGSKYGCSANHIGAAMAINRHGRLFSVDISHDIQAKPHPCVTYVQCDGAKFLREITERPSIIFEDGSHVLGDTTERLKAAAEQLLSGGIIIVHDAESPYVGKDVDAAMTAALGPHTTALIQPSDCGLGWWRKP